MVAVLVGYQDSVGVVERVRWGCETGVDNENSPVLFDPHTALTQPGQFHAGTSQNRGASAPVGGGAAPPLGICNAGGRLRFIRWSATCAGWGVAGNRGSIRARMEPLLPGVPAELISHLDEGCAAAGRRP